MRSIDRIALSLSPLFLRIALGLTFLWAGAGKLFHYVELSPVDQATLVQIETGQPALPPQSETNENALPEPATAEETNTADESNTPPAEEAERPRLRSLTDPSAAAPTPGYSVILAQDSSDSPPDEIAAEDATANVGANPGKSRFLVNVALTIHRAAHPEKGSSLLPAFISDNAMTFAWTVAIIEFVGGACLILGFMTRLWSLAIFGVATGIVWITGIGPAVMGGLDQTFLGFLPPVWPFNPGASMHFFWTLGLMLSAFSLFLLGAGALSIDRILFGNPHRRDDGVAPEGATNV